MSEANEQACGESNASLCSGAAGKAPANGPDVQGTGLPGFAELRLRLVAEKECAEVCQAEADKNGAERFAWRCAGEVSALVFAIDQIDAIEADAKDASKAGERNSTS
jgi:hypothetical protein